MEEMYSLDILYEQYKGRVNEIKNHIELHGDPWPFLMCASFIDILTKMVYGEDSKAKHYKEFIKSHLSKVDKRYRDFEYDSGKKDLPDQMYHVLRCGLVHGFSVHPTITIGKDYEARPRSILLAHRRNGVVHFTKYKNSCVFTAEDFSEDIEKVLDKVFNDARTNIALERSIRTWGWHYPPLGLHVISI